MSLMLASDQHVDLIAKRKACAALVARALKHTTLDPAAYAPRMHMM
jgi:hypothetical protein